MGEKMSKTKELLSENNFRFQKKYGQNFLVNPKIPERISMSVTQNPDGDKELNILEIGAGAGALTVNLAKRYKKVCALEIDESLRSTLEQVLAPYGNAEVVFSDIMKTDISAFCREHFGDGRVAVCANLPYYITTPIIMALFESGVMFESITVMVQKEVALRICSKAGDSDYGAFTAVVGLYSDAKRLFDVKKGNFYPVPKIDSSIIQLTPKSCENMSVTKKQVCEVIRAAFSQRRKTLYNCLTSTYTDMDKERVSQIIVEAGLEPSVRAEQLSVGMFIKLAEILCKK